MDWFQKGKEERKRQEEKEEAIKKQWSILMESGLLDRLEKKRGEVESQTLYRFLLYPSGNTFHVTHAHTSRARGGFYFHVKEDGIYVTVDFYSKGKKIDPQKISDKEIHDWFGQIVPK